MFHATFRVSSSSTVTDFSPNLLAKTVGPRSRRWRVRSRNRRPRPPRILPVAGFRASQPPGWLRLQAITYTPAASPLPSPQSHMAQRRRAHSKEMCTSHATRTRTHIMIARHASGPLRPRTSAHALGTFLSRTEPTLAPRALQAGRDGRQHRVRALPGRQPHRAAG